MPEAGRLEKLNADHRWSSLIPSVIYRRPAMKKSMQAGIPERPFLFSTRVSQQGKQFVGISDSASAMSIFSWGFVSRSLTTGAQSTLSIFFSFFLDFWGMNLRILAVCVVQIDFARLEVSQVMRHPQWSLKSWILHAINHPAISGYPMTMEPPTSCAMNFRPKAVSEIFYGARGRDPSTSETNGHDMVGC